MSVEANFLLCSLKYGFGFSFLYDILHLLRLCIPHKSILISLEDIVFWAYTAIKVFIMMQQTYNGSIRWFSIMGGLLGICLYYKLFSPLFIKYGSRLLNVILGVLRKIWRVISVPAVRVKGKAGKLKKKLTRMKKMLKMTL